MVQCPMVRGERRTGLPKVALTQCRMPMPASAMVSGRLRQYGNFYSPRRLARRVAGAVSGSSGQGCLG